MLARYLFMSINKLLNHFHRREKRIKLQIEQLNELQIRIKSEINFYGGYIANKQPKHIDFDEESTLYFMAELQRKKSANSYLLDELYHELACVRGNIRQLSEAKRRNK